MKNVKNTNKSTSTEVRKKLKAYPESEWGAFKKKTNCTKSQPRKWTDDEINFAHDALEKGYTFAEIGESLDRTMTSVKIKLGRYKKNPDVDTYNEESIMEKYIANMDFYALLDCPPTCLDLFCGVKSFWQNNTGMNVVTNDKDKRIPAMHHMSADKLLAKMYATGKKFDIVDIDCYGDPYKCIDLGIQVAKKGLIVTFGLKKSKQFARIDAVKRYGIRSMKNFKIKPMIDYVKDRAFALDKELDVAHIHENSAIWRVYFTVKHRTTKNYDHEEKINKACSVECA